MRNDIEKLIEEKKTFDQKQRRVTFWIILISLVAISIIFFRISVTNIIISETTKRNKTLIQRLDTAQVVVRRLKTQLDSVRLANDTMALAVKYAESGRFAKAIGAYNKAIE